MDIKNKCKMCESTDNGMNNSTCNWVNHTKYTTSILSYCRCNVMIVVVGFMSRVQIVISQHQRNLAALNVQMLQKFLLSINNKTCVHMILHTIIFQLLIQIMVS